MGVSLAVVSNSKGNARLGQRARTSQATCTRRAGVSLAQTMQICAQTAAAMGRVAPPAGLLVALCVCPHFAVQPKKEEGIVDLSPPRRVVNTHDNDQNESTTKPTMHRTARRGGRRRGRRRAVPAEDTSESGAADDSDRSIRSFTIIRGLRIDAIPRARPIEADPRSAVDESESAGGPV